MSRLWFHCVVILLCLYSQKVCGDEGALYDTILTSYNKYIRPKTDHTETVEVELEFELIKINDLSDTAQVLQTVGFFVATWYDEHLTWTPSGNDDIESLVLPPSVIWLPDIGIENSADYIYQDTFRKDFHVRVDYTGFVQWSFGGLISTFCDLDMTYYPFDRQKCLIQIENWAYHGNEVQLRNKTEGIDLDAYVAHGIWEIFDTKTEYRDLYYSALGPEPYPEVDFIMFLDRKSGFYVMNMMMPVVLIIIVALGVFWLPADSGEKVSLGVTVLLAFSVFQIVLSESIPTTSDYTPILAQLVVSVMVLASVSTLISILVLYLHHKETDQRPPQCVRIACFRKLATLLCMRGTMPDVTTGAEVNPADEDMVMQDLEKKGAFNGGPAVVATGGNGGDMAEIAANLRYITNKVKEKERLDVIRDEWKSVAKVIDRLMFWICFITCIIVLLVFTVRRDPDH